MTDLQKFACGNITWHPDRLTTTAVHWNPNPNCVQLQSILAMVTRLGVSRGIVDFRWVVIEAMRVGRSAGLAPRRHVGRQCRAEARAGST